MKFIFDDPDIGFTKADVPNTEVTLEIQKDEEDSFTIWWSCKGSYYECGVFTKAELKVLWKMLSSK